jgi:NAD(P)-dependent dehydrogenase (short-subunit alcohol dehydrogenase family)
MNRVALVTGGSRGIGLGIARCLAREHWDLAICGVRAAAEVEASFEDLRAGGVGVLYCQADVADREDRERLLDAVRRHYGRLHLLVNNAGVAPLERKDILEATEASYERVMKTNLQGPYFLTQAVANWMIEQRREAPDFAGCIVNVSSVSATMASVNRGEYCISKAGISMATKLWAVRLAEHGIPVYELRPGIVLTDMTKGVKERYDRMIEGGLMLQARWGTPEDIGKAVAMLARGDLAYSTGQVVTVDGGLGVERL